MTLYALIPMLILAFIDLKYTRWDYTENLKMTKDEVKDELKQAEGDPKVKAAVRQKMMQMSRRRMLQDVPKADVVITNPTHYAVALLYNRMEAPAPVVVAKGVDRLAEKIKEVARANQVPIRENKALARALYSQVEIGEMIPEELYKATAAILAQVWKIKGKKIN
jgi:flagellar biosynthetic protein FlhB